VALIDTGWAPNCAFPARWFVMSPDPERLAHLENIENEAADMPLDIPGVRPWTDEHASLLKILR
jgi:hypothetical protein